MSLLGSLFLSVLVLELSSAHPLSFNKGGVAAGQGDFGPEVLSKTIRCPGGEECPDDNTCCSIGEDKYGCCAVSADAVCCPDHTHCCRPGYKCGEKTCTEGVKVHPLVRLVTRPKTTPPPLQNIVCPGGKEECPNGNTCCSIGNSRYGCCPDTDAMCCPDLKHCCPKHYTCHSTGCSKEVKGHPLLQLLSLPADVKESSPPPGSVVCPDEKSECPDGNTCCLKKGGSEYGCCPKKNAVCCSDGTHCCAEHYFCNSNGFCSHADSNLPFMPLVSSLIQTPPPLRNIVCPGGHYQCEDGYTCCPTADGKYGCCGIADAYCCPDMVHCCPQHYKCSDGKCMSPENSDHPLLQLISAPLVEKTPPLLSLQTVQPSPQGTECPDHNMYCFGSDTCCRMEGGGFGCCPQPKAVCCDDLKHCCAQNYTCKSGKCSKGDDFAPLLQIVQPSPPLPDTDYPPANVVCPDGKSECAEGSTCCMTAAGVYGCCPKSNGVCCHDMTHCCPQGYTCDTPDGKCIESSEHPLLDLLSRPVQESSRPVKNVVCPGAREECPDKNTCCVKANNAYGCCPKVNGVCCHDMVHCCPEGYKCDSADGKCVTGSSEHPLLLLLNPPVQEALVKNINCPGNHQQCPDGDTCCSVGGDAYSCCPEPDAVCCKDKKHCCPKGFTCEETEGKCLRVDDNHPLLQLISSPPSTRAWEL